MDIMDIMIITDWMTMAGAVSALVFSGPEHWKFHIFGLSKGQKIKKKGWIWNFHYEKLMMPSFEWNDAVTRLEGPDYIQAYQFDQFNMKKCPKCGTQVAII